MLAAILVIVSVATGDAHDPTTEAMVRAAHDVLGADASLEVRERDAPPRDVEVAAAGGSAESVVLADVRWSDATKTRAHVRLRARGSARWLERDIGFDVIDAPSERGRTLGFALASMLPSSDAAHRSHADPPPSVAPPRPPAGAPASTSADAPDEAPGPSSAAARAAALREARPGARSLYAAGVVTRGIAGTAGSIGATFAGEWQAFRPVAFRLAGSFRAGEVPAAQASSLFVHAGVGVAFVFLPATRSRPVGCGLRADALLELQSLAHLSADDPASARQTRFLPGADLFGEATYAFTDSTALVGALGGEAAFGTTAVYTHRVHVVDVPALRIAAELGVRARF